MYDRYQDKSLIYILIPTTPERKEKLALTLASIAENKLPHVVCIYESEGEGGSIALFKMLQGINGLCFVLNDDMVIAPDCLEKLYFEWLRKIPEEDVLLQPFDNINKGKLAVSPFCHSDVLKKYFYHGYIHCFADTELTEVLKAKGSYFYVPEAKMQHNHYKITNKNDDTYQFSRDHHAVDRELYFKRKANGFEPKNF